MIRNARDFREEGLKSSLQGESQGLLPLITRWNIMSKPKPMSRKDEKPVKTQKEAIVSGVLVTSASLTTYEIE